MEIKLFNKKRQNASQYPKRYFGLHMTHGLAHYSEEDVTSLIRSETIKKMDASFEGKPVFIIHNSDHSLENLERTMDGVVVRSFFNPADGHHWVEFMVHTDAGHEAIRKGWKLSNAYDVRNAIDVQDGKWHGADYNEEVLDAVYNHLAIVPNPRYSESVILTPDQFKEYNNKLEAETLRRKNSLEGDTMEFNLFKKQKVDNAKELMDVSVTLPKSGKEMSLKTVINSSDEKISSEGKAVEAKDADTVKIGEETITVSELKKRYENACKKNEEEDKSKENEDEDDDSKENMDEDDRENEDDEDEDSKENEEVVHPKSDEKKLNSKRKNALEDEAKKKANIDKLKTARENAITSEQPILSVGNDFVNRGKSLYGSDKK